jgi:hypothetical protein
MTCEEFERLAIDLTRGEALAGVELHHASSCPRCAGFIATQAHVSDSLRALADADTDRGAPARTEAIVRAAFQARWMRDREEVVTIANAATVHAFIPRTEETPHADDRSSLPIFAQQTKRSSVRWPAIAAAAAAVLLVSLMRLAPENVAPVQTPASPAIEQTTAHHVEHPVRRRSTTTPRGATVAPQSAIAANAGNAAHAATIANVAPPAANPNAVADVIAAAGTNAHRQSLAVDVATTGRRDGTRPTVNVLAQREDEGVETDDQTGFTPLPYAEPLRPTEMRQVVRVSMGHAEAVKAGLPTNGTSDRVVADVLVGEDGIARGVRIVPKQ